MVKTFGKYCCVCGKVGNREPRSRWWEGDLYRYNALRRRWVLEEDEVP